MLPRGRRAAGRTPRGGRLVRDPLATWGATAKMGPKELLGAVDHAAKNAGAATGAHHGLWERLSCRAQALAPDLTAPELCRALFGFYRARLRGDASLLHAARDAILSERPGRHLSANDTALMLKALSKHGFDDAEVADFLLYRAGEKLETMAPADVSELLAAVIRLGLEGRLDEDGPHPTLLEGSFARVRARLGDTYLPPADLTNLCVAAALFRPVEEGSLFLLDAVRLLERRTLTTPPRDTVQRLLSVVAFEKGLRQRAVATCGVGGAAKRPITSVVEALEPPGLAAVCHRVCLGLARRVHELEVVTSVAACEAMAALLPHCWSQPVAGKKMCGASADVLRRKDELWTSHASLVPLLTLVLQRAPGMPAALLRRTAEAATALANLHGDPVLMELLAFIPDELSRRPEPLQDTILIAPVTEVAAVQL